MSRLHRFDMLFDKRNMEIILSANIKLLPNYVKQSLRNHIEYANPIFGRKFHSRYYIASPSGSSQRQPASMTPHFQPVNTVIRDPELAALAGWRTKASDTERCSWLYFKIPPKVRARSTRCWPWCNDQVDVAQQKHNAVADVKDHMGCKLAYATRSLLAMTYKLLSRDELNRWECNFSHHQRRTERHSELDVHVEQTLNMTVGSWGTGVRCSACLMHI